VSPDGSGVGYMVQMKLIVPRVTVARRQVDSGLSCHVRQLIDVVEIVDVQQGILRESYNGSDNEDKYSQMWCMYKEVQGYFAEGVRSLESLIG